MRAREIDIMSGRGWEEGRKTETMRVDERERESEIVEEGGTKRESEIYDEKRDAVQDRGAKFASNCLDRSAGN